MYNVAGFSLRRRDLFLINFLTFSSIILLFFFILLQLPNSTFVSTSSKLKQSQSTRRGQLGRMQQELMEQTLPKINQVTCLKK